VNVIHQGDVFSDWTRDIVEWNKVSQALESLQEDQKADPQLSVFGVLMSEGYFFGRRGVEVSQFFVRDRVFQTRISSFMDVRHGLLPIACDVRTSQDKLLGEVDKLLNRWRGGFLTNRCHTPDTVRELQLYLNPQAEHLLD